MLDRWIGQVLDERPRHPGADLFCTGIDAFAPHSSDGAAVAVLRSRDDLRLLLEAHVGEVLFAALPERLTLFRRIDLRQADHSLRLVVASNLDRVSVADSNDEAQQDCFRRWHAYTVHSSSNGVEMDEQEWIARCSARLHAQWPRVDRQQRDDIAADLVRAERWRVLEPEQAAFEWLRQGIPTAA